MNSNKNKSNINLILNQNDVRFLGKFLLLNNYTELQQALKLINQDEISKFCYFQKNLINDILYYEEKIINIYNNNNKNNFSFYFYLVLLIEDNVDIINYSYDYNFFNEINSENKLEKNEIKKVIISKIILELIFNFRGFNKNKNIKTNLDSIEKHNKENIRNNICIFRELNLNLNGDEIEEMKLDEIYSEIIISLIKNKKFEDYDYSYNILHQLEIDNLEITKKIYDDLSVILNSKESFINNYLIINLEDIYDIKKINFYYILFKFILKRSIYIYSIPLLLNYRKTIISNIKNGIYFNFGDDDNTIKERFDFNLKFALNSNYYYNLYLNNKNEEVKIILEYYKKYCFESNKNEINNIKGINSHFQRHIKDFDKIREMVDEYCIVEYIYNYKNNGEVKTEKKIQEVSKNWKFLKKMIKDKKIKKMRKDDKLMLRKYFDDMNNKELLLKIFGEDCYRFFIKESGDIIYKENKRNIDLDILKEILNYYKTFLFESKINDINLIENFIKNKGVEINYESYLKNFEIAKNMNIKFPLINYLFNIQNENGKIVKNEFKIKNILNKYEKIEKMIRDMKIKKMRREDKNKIFNFFCEPNNKPVLLKIFDLEKYEFILKESTKYLNQNKKNNLNKEIIDKAKEILKYYKQYHPETKKDDIISIEEIIKNNSDKYEKHLTDYEIAKEMNLKTPLINLFINLNDNKVSEEEINKVVESWKATEKIIKDKKIKKMRGDYKKKLINFCKNKNNKDILIKIFTKDIYDYFIKINKINFEENDVNNNIIHNSNLAKKENIIIEDKLISSSEDESTNCQTGNIKENEFNEKREEEIVEHILKESKIKLHVNSRKEEPFIIYKEINIGNNNIILENNDLQKYKEYFIKNKIEAIITKSYLKFIEFIDEFEIRIKTEFKYNYNLKINLHFKKIGLDKNTGLYDIQCIYYFFSPGNNEIETFKEENILINKTNSKLQGFQFLIEEINNEKYKDIKFEEENQNEINIINENRKTIDTYDEILEKDAFQLDSLPSENKIIGFISIIGTHKKAAENIVELSNNYFISAGSEDGIIIYDEKFEFVEKLNENVKDINNRIYAIVEIKNNNNKSNNELNAIGCGNKELYLLHFNSRKKTCKRENYELPNMTCVSCVQMKDNNFVITGQNKTTYYRNLLFNQEKDVFKYEIIKDKTYREAIKISDNLIALTSNSFIVDGEDKLIFFNIAKNKKCSQIQGYSFIASTNGLFLLSREINKQANKILFCACKKYFQNQKNGILLVNAQKENKQKIEIFYDTRKFEVYCFCPIYLYNDKNNKIETNFLFVGGFDVERHEGRIKLFKILYNEMSNINNIEYLQDIEFGFEGAVSSIIQSEKYGNFLVSCYDGNIYLFTKINLDFYLNNNF